jgi:hypothetical protein
VVVPRWTFSPGSSEAPQWDFGFSRFGDALSDWTPVFEEVLKDFKKGEIEQFRSEGSYGSGSWKRLSGNYAAWKEEQKPGSPILVFSGLLRAAATNPKAQITKDQMLIIIDDAGSYTVSTKTKGTVTRHKPAVAGYHQKGAGHLPRRPVIQLPKSQIVRWQKIWQSYMVGATRAPWGRL